MKPYKLGNLGGIPRDVFCAGATFIYVKSAPHDLTIQVDGSQDKLEIPAGGHIELPAPVKEKIVVTSPDGVADFVLMVGLGRYDEPQLVGNVTVKPFDVARGLDLITFNTNSKTVPANEKRRELHITADSGNDGVVYHSASVAGKGTPIEAGQTVVIPLRGALDLYATQTGDKVHLTEFE